MAAKQQRRLNGTNSLKEWQAQRQLQIQNRIRTNKELQESNELNAIELKKSMNPWQRVCANVEFTTSATTASGKDVSRMKAAMIARKADLTQIQTKQPML